MNPWDRLNNNLFNLSLLTNEELLCTIDYSDYMNNLELEELERKFDLEIYLELESEEDLETEEEYDILMKYTDKLFKKYGYENIGCDGIFSMFYEDINFNYENYEDIMDYCDYLNDM